MNNLILALLTSLIIIIAACSSSRNQEIEKIPMISEPQIVFLNYNLIKNSASQPSIELINKIITKGKIKKNKSSISNPENGDLEIIELNKEEKPIAKIFVATPLVKTVEYTNNKGQLTKKKIDLEMAQLSIRMQLNPSTTSIEIRQIDNTSTSNTTLIVHKIK